MSEGLGDKVQGKVDELGGKTKQAVGNVTDNDELKAEGASDEAKGKAEGFLGKIKDIAEDVADTAKGLVEKAGDKIEDVTHKGHTHTHEDGTTHSH